MKLFIVICISLNLVGCNKEQIGLSEDYQLIIGEWKENYGDSKSSFIFKKNQKLVFKSGLDRGYTRKIERFTFVDQDQSSGWRRYALGSSEVYYLSIFISSMGDSLWAGGLSTDEASIQQQTKQYYTKVQ